MPTAQRGRSSSTQIVVVLLLFFVASACGLDGRRRSVCFLGFKRKEPYLLEFGGKAVKEESKKMAPIMRRIERQYKTRIVRFDIYSDAAAYRLWLLLDKSPRGASLCGGLPFYYNRKTGAIICGPTTTENFEAWAAGEDHKTALPPPLYVFFLSLFDSQYS